MCLVIELHLKYLLYREMNYLISNVINIMCPTNLVECYIFLFVKMKFYAITLKLIYNYNYKNFCFSKIVISLLFPKFGIEEIQ